MIRQVVHTLLGSLLKPILTIFLSAAAALLRCASPFENDFGRVGGLHDRFTGRNGADTGGTHDGTAQGHRKKDTYTYLPIDLKNHPDVYMECLGMFGDYGGDIDQRTRTSTPRWDSK